MKPFTRLFLITLATILIPLVAQAQSQTRPGADAATYNSELEIGPIPGLTTVWHPAPTATAAALGTTLQFRATNTAGRIEWTGAQEIEWRNSTSTAEIRLTTPGPYLVMIEYTDYLGEQRQERSLLNVVDTLAFPITLSNPRILADPVSVDESSSNQTTMNYFFGDSIAAVRQLDEGHYLTSKKRWFQLEVDVEPPGFAPLVEWRLNKKAQRHLGRGIKMQIFPVRLHTIEVGTDESSQAISLQIYRVHITSHESGIDEVPEYTPVTFTAITDPPGYENEITWLASTKYGACEPVMGQGPEFTVSFQNTFVPAGQWLGVKADHAKSSQDKKGSATDCLAESDEIQITSAQGIVTISNGENVFKISRLSIPAAIKAAGPTCAEGDCVILNVDWEDSLGLAKGNLLVQSVENKFVTSFSDSQAVEIVRFGTCYPIPPTSPGPTFPDPSCPFPPFPFPYLFPTPFPDPYDSNTFLMIAQTETLSLSQVVNSDDTEEFAVSFSQATDLVDEPQIDVTGFASLGCLLSNDQAAVDQLSNALIFSGTLTLEEVQASDRDTKICAASALTCGAAGGLSNPFGAFACGFALGWIIFS